MKMKTPSPRRPRDEDLCTKKTKRQRAPHQEDLDMKTTAPRRLEEKGSHIKKALKTHLCAKKILEAKALGMKTYTSGRS